MGEEVGVDMKEGIVENLIKLVALLFDEFTLFGHAV